VPHVNIKHFPASLCEEQQAELVAVLTAAVRSAFSCDEGVISIALEPVEEDAWTSGSTSRRSWARSCCARRRTTDQ
jgi:phenylpyruvate tautomerase PptA (4-oxalocrotonate tautomerase family)